MKFELFFQGIAHKTYEKRLLSTPKEMPVFFNEFLRMHGLVADEDHWQQGSHRSYEEMSTEAVRQLASQHDLSGIDLVLLAFHMHDCESGDAVSSYLLHEFGWERALSFAVSEQSTAAPLTALRLINDYFVAGDRKQALLVVVDQTTLPSVNTELARRDVADSCAAILVTHEVQPDAPYLIEYRYAPLDTAELPLMPAVRAEVSALLDRHDIALPDVVLVGNSSVLAMLRNWQEDRLLVETDSRHMCTAHFFALLGANALEHALLMDFDGKDSLTLVLLGRTGSFRALDRSVQPA